MRHSLLILLALTGSGCAISDATHERQHATVSCRDLGFFGATKDAGAWYCYKEKLVLPVTKGR
jgi:hypothetical protein